MVLKIMRNIDVIAWNKNELEKLEMEKNREARTGSNAIGIRG